MSMFSFNNKFKNATLNKGEDGCYRLNVFYESTDEFGNVDLIEINGIPLYFSDNPSSDISVCSIYSYPEASINLGFGELNFDRKTKLKRTRIKNADAKEMTLEEIEKCLGHKVKIVTNKEK